MSENSKNRELYFSELQQNPRNTSIRLKLAKLFYLDGYTEFAVRELVRLKDFYQSEVLDKLIDSFGGSGIGLEKPREAQVEDKEEEVLGEIDIEADIEELLKELEDK